MRTKILRLMVVLVMISSVLGSVGLVAADHYDGTAADDVVYVDADNVDAANGTYGTIQDAIDNASDGYHVDIKATTYNTSEINLTANNLHIISNTSGETVYVDAKLNGTADENVTNVYIGDDVTFSEGVVLTEETGVGAIGGNFDSVMDDIPETIWGVPTPLVALFVIVVVYAFYVERNQ